MAIVSVVIFLYFVYECLYLSYISCLWLIWFIYSYYVWVSLVAQTMKSLPAMKKTWVRALGWEDPLDNEMSTYSSILAWRIPWTEEPGGLKFMGRYESNTPEQLHFHFSFSCIGEGNGNPLQYSCLDPRDREVWWAAVYGIAKSRTLLKWLSSSSSTATGSMLKSRDITLPKKVRLVKAMIFFSSHLWMWELNYKEIRVPNNWCFFFFFSVTAPFDLEDSRRIQDSKRREWRSAWGGRKRGREKERERERERPRARARMHEGERVQEKALWLLLFLPPGPALCKLGLARSAVCSAWSFHSGPRTFLWPTLSFSRHHFGLLFPILPT